MGWVPPMGSHSDALTHVANGQIVICARKEEKILPSPVIKQALEAKIAKLEAEQARKLKKTEKDSLKDEVLHSLLPRAFSRFSQTMMWIDTVNGLIMVDCASAKKAEDTLALLRKSLGSLPVVPLSMENPIELTLTEWVRSGSAAQGFQLLDEAELKSLLEDGGVIRAKKQDLTSEEITNHIEAGKVGTVIVKDMSRLGRNYLQVGFYTEMLFPQKGVRFIAVNDNVDSASEGMDNDFTPLRNLFNEWLVRDTSKKIKAVKKSKGMSGKPVTSKPVYGYVMDEDENFIIDEEAAPVVQQIYQLCLAGNGPTKIARMLISA